MDSQWPLFIIVAAIAVPCFIFFVRTSDPKHPERLAKLRKELGIRND